MKRQPTIEAVVAAAERSTRRRPRLGPEALRLLIEAFWQRLPSVVSQAVGARRGVVLRSWYQSPHRTEAELRGLLVELALVAAEGSALGTHWLEALGVDPEEAQA